MADVQTIVRKAAGLYSQHNPLNAVPEGALLEAENAVIDREGIISTRRGFDQYGSALSAVGDDLMEYKNRLLVRISNEVAYDADGAGGSWTKWNDGGTTALFNPPSGFRTAWVEMNSNFYMTTENGIWKNDSLTGTPVQAGMPKGLDIQLSLNVSNTWFPADSQVGYKIVWGRTDGNNNLLLGAPSEREVATNPATGATKSVDLTFSVPRDIRSGDFYEVYRTFNSATEDTDPGERFYKVVRKDITSAQITARSVAFNDIYSEAWLGSASGSVPLYSNDTMEGSTQINDRPPVAKVMAVYQGHIFFGSTRREHQIEIRLLTNSGLVADTSAVTFLTAGNTLTYTFSTVEDISNRKFKLFTGGVEAEDVRDTMKSLVHVINMDLAQSEIYAWYVSGPNDWPGRIVIIRQDYDDSVITITADSNDLYPYTGTKFEPELPISGTTIASDNSAKKNGLARTKYQQPEAVPFFNDDVIGNQDKEILAMEALKDALLIEKEDGLYILTGKTDGTAGASFEIEILDPTVLITAKNTAALLDNSFYSLTSQGIVRAVPVGSAIVSRPIEPDLNRIAEIANFSTLAFGVAYESDRKYLLATPENSDDTQTQLVWVYNYITGAWTVWRLNVQAGIALKSDDRLYFADATTARVIRERKSYSTDDDDYQDYKHTGTITATSTDTDINGQTVTTATVTYTDSASLAVGWYLEQGSAGGRVILVTDLGGNSYTLKLDVNITLTTGACDLYEPITLKVQWAPEDGGNATAQKHFSICQLYMESDSANSHQLAFKADIQQSEESVGLIRFPRETGNITQHGWGSFPWGSLPWGLTRLDEFATRNSSTPVRCAIPQAHQRCRALRISYQHSVAREAINILQLALDARMVGSRTARRSY